MSHAHHHIHRTAGGHLPSRRHKLLKHGSRRRVVVQVVDTPQPEAGLLQSLGRLVHRHASQRGDNAGALADRQLNDRAREEETAGRRILGQDHPNRRVEILAVSGDDHAKVQRHDRLGRRVYRTAQEAR